MPLSFSLLGQATIYHNGTPLRQFRSQKEPALLIYLAHTGMAHARDTLADLFWEGRTAQQARSNLRTILARLRKQVNDDLQTTRKHVALRPDNSNHVDSSHLLAALADVSRVSSAEEAEELESTLVAYRGAFLANFDIPDAPGFEQWVRVTQAHILVQVCSAYRKLGDYAVAAAEAEYGLAVARRWLQVDEWDEDAHYLLLQMLMTSGQEQLAVDHYQGYARGVRSEFGVEPSPRMDMLMGGLRPRPLAVWQPQPGSRPRSQHNLPTPHDAFFGRKVVQQEIHARLDRPWCRLVTLTGPGGIGKTRLAIKVARDRVAHYADGVWLVELAHLDLDDPDVGEAVAVEIATATGLRLQGQSKPITQLIAHLKDKQLLLILDNFDALVKDGMPLILDLLRHCESVQLLVTSREPLGIRAEWMVRLSGLSCSARDDNAWVSDAMNLFLARWEQRQRRTLDATERLQVQRLVCMLEGWPLAIELAASLGETTTVNEMLEQLENGLESPSFPWADVPERHRSLNAIFETSWRTLPAELGLQLARLSVFQGSFTEAAAARVTGATRSHLQALCDKSLLSYDENTGRYQLHIIVRHLAALRLEADDRTPLRHVRYYLGQQVRYFSTSQLNGLKQVISRIEQDMDNIRVAWRRALALQEGDLLLAALPMLSTYYQLRGLIYEGEMVMRTTWQTAMAWGAVGIPLVIWVGVEWAHFLNHLGRHHQSIDISARTLAFPEEEGGDNVDADISAWWGEASWTTVEHERVRELADT